MLADEPTSNLDPDSATELARVLKDIHGVGPARKTVIVVSHDPLFLGRRDPSDRAAGRETSCPIPAADQDLP